MKPPCPTEPPKEVNSLTYWEHRFSNDWEEQQGREQSRFFSTVAAELMPSWLLEYSQQNNLTICDWGCAQGDGTVSLSQALGFNSITGVDFSPEAISKAQQAYPQHTFMCADFLKEQDGKTWDILFSSNTLEHFEAPWAALEKIADRARKFIILLLPFREQDRIDEHFYTFDYDNIPFLKGKWALVHCRSISTADRTPCYWPGEQILLIYANNEEIQGVGHTLDRIEIESNASKLMKANELDMLHRTRQLLEQLSRSKEELGQAVCALNASAEREKELQDQLSELSNLHTQLMGQHSKLLNSHSWQLTAPLRLAARLARHGLQPHDRHKLRQVLKSCFYRLPMPAALRNESLKAYRKLRGQPAPVIGTPIFMDESTFPQIRPVPQQDGVPDYIFWGVIDWHFRHQRPQQLAQALAKAGRRVFYISVNLVDSKQEGFNVEQLDKDGRLFQVNLYAKGAPVVYYNPAGVDTTEQLRASIGRMLQWASSGSLVSVIQHPFWYETAFVLPNSRVVYDCMDHHEGFGNVSEQMLAIEKALVTQSDLTITTSSWLDEMVAKSTSRRALIRNAGEYDHFANIPAQLHQDSASKKIIGYYGAIAEWFDVDLVEAIAKRFPEHTILLIGADTVNAASQLSKYTNVIFTGEKPYAELPKYLHAFDVCLLPFKVIPLTLATNPVKVYEYLSAGKPVVSVDLPEIRQFDNLVHAAVGHEAFMDAIEQVLNNTNTPEQIRQRQAFARNQTWAHRAELLINEIEAPTEQGPRVSVIVVTYNNLELTKACLHSLDRHTNHTNLEIIVVDNASADGSPDYLREWAAAGSNRRLLLNDDNLGFAAANNQGLAVADGEYLVLLNNDTVVTPGWIGTLYRHLERDNTLGIIGPVTNNIGNEAKIQIQYSDMEEMVEESQKYTRMHIGKLHKMHTTAFFCVMMPRHIYEKVGPLDEAFGRGFFEDDDYCRRIQQHGYSVACAEDVFIHHHLSASFNKLRSAERQALFEQNKALYEAKWGPWVPHNYRSDARK